MSVSVASSTSLSTLTSPTRSSSTGRSSVTWRSVVTPLNPSWPPSRPVSPILTHTLPPRRSSPTLPSRSSPPPSTPRTRRPSVSVPSRSLVYLTSTPHTCSTRAPPSSGLPAARSLAARTPVLSSPPVPIPSSAVKFRFWRWTVPSTISRSLFTLSPTFPTLPLTSTESFLRRCLPRLTHPVPTTELASCRPLLPSPSATFTKRETLLPRMPPLLKLLKHNNLCQFGKEAVGTTIRVRYADRYSLCN
mmetsp:Transcript_11443/g.25641  ORF Transcript_11443/g.25641 Transcript_11443/m.25641 type:complete len:247 (+) Transcript_11443:287-1027(+)